MANLPRLFLCGHHINTTTEIFMESSFYTVAEFKCSIEQRFFCSGCEMHTRTREVPS